MCNYVRVWACPQRPRGPISNRAAAPGGLGGAVPEVDPKL